jgi:hypothetical protein
MKKIILILALSTALFSNAQKVDVKTETVGNITKIDHYAQAKNDLYDIMQVVKLESDREEWVFNTMISKYDFLNENQSNLSPAELKKQAKDMCMKLPRIFTENEMAIIKKANLEVYNRVFE